MNRPNIEAELGDYTEVILKTLVWAGVLESKEENGETFYRYLGGERPSQEELQTLIDKYNRGESPPSLRNVS